MNTPSKSLRPPAGCRTPLALALLVTLALGACAPSKLRPTQSAEPSHVRLPFVRTLLSDTEPEATIGGQGAIAIECLRGAERFVYYSPKNVRLRFTGGAIGLVNSKNEIIESSLDQVTISARNSKRLLWVNGAAYRGMVRLTPGERGLTLVNVLYIEDYLRGVVPPELGPLVSADDMESIKAQAIAARTYTMSHLGQYGALPYDLKSDVSDQVYRGASAEKDFISRAVIATTGEVARYQEQFINAYYHSTCGGRTDNIENVWEKPAAPYLKSVDCDSMCSPSKYFRWNETFSGAELVRFINDYETAQRGQATRYSRIDDIAIDNSQPITRTPGLRTQTLTIVADGVTLRYQRDRIRWVIRRASDPNRILQSDYFALSDIRRAADGSVQSVTFNGRGYGHGVGMCQMGAIGMGRTAANYTYRDILKRYYRGITIDRLY